MKVYNGILLVSFILHHTFSTKECDNTLGDERNKVRFSMHCNHLVTTRLDPDTFPGTCASHVHSVFGNNNFNREVGIEHLYGKGVSTTCSSPHDRSMYWIPSLYSKDNDDMYNILYPNKMTVHYRDRTKEIGTNITRWREELKPFPIDFRMRVDAKTNPYVQKWQCMDRANSPIVPLEAKQGFPTWDSLKQFRNQCNEISVFITFPACFKTSNRRQQTEGKPVRRDTGLCHKHYYYRFPELQFNFFWNLESLIESLGTWDNAIDSLIMANGDKTGAEIYAVFISGWFPKRLLDAMENCHFKPGAASGRNCPKFMENMSCNSTRRPDKLGNRMKFGFDREPVFVDQFPGFDATYDNITELATDKNQNCNYLNMI